MRIPSIKPTLTETTEHQISFHDTDAMGVMWHGNYIRFMEYAREALFRKIGYGYKDMFDSGYVWPVIDIRVKYVRPAIVEQKIQIHAHLIEYEHRVKVEYLFFDKKSGQKIAYGYSIQVAVEQKSQEMQLVSPSVLLTKIEALKNA